MEAAKKSLGEKAASTEDEDVATAVASMSKDAPLDMTTEP